jgi:glutamyl-tRNA(Gln) amidotransferase subunit D
MYSKPIQALFKRKKLVPGRDHVKIFMKKKIYTGLLLPRTYFGDHNSIVLKLANGYNIGVQYKKGMKIRKIQEAKLKIKPRIIKQKKKSPKVTIIGAGGTIISKLDYRTGGVIPLFTPEEILGTVPQIANIAHIKVISLFSELSGNLTPSHWEKIAKTISSEIKKGVDGIVVMHGTDTMHYTAAALAFALEDLPIPVVLTGAQRSSDRGSGDSFLNIKAAVKTAVSDIAEVTVCMHGSSDDDFCYLMRGVKARKCHTSRRDAFKPINEKPIAIIKKDLKIESILDYKKRSKSKLKLKPKFSSAALIKTYPGIKITIPKGVKGLVIEGTGLGHAPKYILNDLKRFKKPIVMTSQCIWGRVNMNIYEYGRDLQTMGVVGNFLDMTPETAFVKLSWLLSNHPKQVKKMMLTNLRGEITKKSEEEDFFDEEP